MRILVLRGGALGDFLVTLPALRLLRERWSDARIELVGNARAGELGVLAGLLAAVHSQDEARWTALFSSHALPVTLETWLAAFDLVINYWPDPDGVLARRFPVRPGQTYLSASAQPTLAPAARHFCAPLRALGLSTNDFCSRLAASRMTAPRDALPFEADRGVIAIHPGSGSRRKNWPPDRWLELIDRLDQPVLLVLGEAERDPWSGMTLAHGWPDAGDRPRRGQSLHLARALPLPALAAVLARSRLFLGHDSGVSHLAAAVGTPCVLLFGPTDPAIWAPPGRHVRVLRRGDVLDAISVDEVWALALQADPDHAAGALRSR